jgi:hypothetical protein
VAAVEIIVNHVQKKCVQKLVLVHHVHHVLIHVAAVAIIVAHKTPNKSLKISICLLKFQIKIVVNFKLQLIKFMLNKNYLIMFCILYFRFKN